MSHRRMSSALVARLRHLESQVASLETTCASRVDALARACDALREENEALRAEVARRREVDQTLLEGLLDDLAPVSSHDRVGDDGVDAGRATATATVTAPSPAAPSARAERLGAFLHGWDEDEGRKRPRDEGQRPRDERAAPSVKIEPSLGSEARRPSAAFGDGGESESEYAAADEAEDDGATCQPVPRMYETAANGRQFLLCKHALKKAWCPECQSVPRKPKGKPNNRPAGSVCEHGKRRATCKTCKGASICPHGRRKTICRLCGGGSICVHGRYRYRCVLCKGGAVCRHNRRKYQCTLCFAERACEHGLDAKECADCVLLKVELAEFGSEDTFEDV